jgi:hypothetical protein
LLKKLERKNLVAKKNEVMGFQQKKKSFFFVSLEATEKDISFLTHTKIQRYKVK